MELPVSHTPPLPGRRLRGRRSSRGRFGHVYAALDLGTNNCRLLIARPTPDGFKVIDSFSRIVRLGEGLGATGRLGEAAMARTIEALAVCADKIRRRGADRVRAVATEACRRAANCQAFVDWVAAATGLRLDIVSAAEEAGFALAGCAALLVPESRHALVFDIGGGSTELMWLEQSRPGEPRLAAWASLPTGVVTLAERWGGADVDAGAYQGMTAEVLPLLAAFEAEHGLGRRFAADGVQFLGTSGTVTTLAAVHFDLKRYDRTRVDGAWISFADVARISRRLVAMSYGERMAHPCIGRERADLVVAGCAVLAAMCRTWPAERLRVADRGVREGLLLRLMADAEAEAATAPPG